jgi:hypothetical protein
VKESLPVPARALGLTIRYWEVRDPDAFEKVFAALTQERPEGVYVTSSLLVSANLAALAATPRRAFQPPLIIEKASL